MLVEFSVENYRSFQERQTFSMVASEDEAMLESNSFPMPGAKDLRLLTSNVIYGSNASGKSNLLRALQELKNIVVNSASKMQLGDRFDVEPFLLNTNYQKRPTCFEIVFVCNRIRYEYGLNLDKKRVHEEWLLAYPKGRPQTWFSRTYDPKNPELKSDEGYKWNFGSGLKGEKERIKKFVRSNSLFLSHAAQNNHPQLTEVFEWFRSNLNLISPDLPAIYTVHRCREDDAFRKEIVQLIAQADIGISDISVEVRSISDAMKPILENLRDLIRKDNNLGEIQESEQDNFQTLEILFSHKMTESNKLVAFRMEDESEGTKRLFEMAGPWLNVLQDGEVLMVDELDRSLHSVLSKALLKMFNNPEINKKNAQLIFTTHDTTLLDGQIFRKDQVWFTEKDKSMTKLYSLQEFKPREDESLQKGYLRGRYGAIPFVVGLSI